MISRTTFCSDHAALIRRRRLRSDLVHLFEPRAVPVDDVEHLFAELRDELLGQHGSDAFDQPAAEILFDALARGGSLRREAFGAELQPVFRVAHPIALGQQPLAAVHRGERPQDGHQVALPAHVDAQDREAVLFVEERHPLDLAFDGFHVEVGIALRRFPNCPGDRCQRAHQGPGASNLQDGACGGTPPAVSALKPAAATATVAGWMLPRRPCRSPRRSGWRSNWPFLMEADKLKTILRRNRVVSDESRRENDAEHMYHFALMVMILGEYANAPCRSAARP